MVACLGNRLGQIINCFLFVGLSLVVVSQQMTSEVCIDGGLIRPTCLSTYLSMQTKDSAQVT